MPWSPRTQWRAPSSWQLTAPLPMVDAEGRPLCRLDGDWTPGLLVLAWPDLFVGAEDPDRKQVELAVLMLADAGQVELYLAPVWGAARPGLRIVAREPDPALSGDAWPERVTSTGDAPPWVWEAVLAEARASRPGSYGERLSRWRGHTLRAAEARGLVVPGRRDRFFVRAARVDPDVASTSRAEAARLAQWWARFVALQPDLYEALVRATGISGAVVA